MLEKLNQKHLLWYGRIRGIMRKGRNAQMTNVFLNKAYLLLLSDKLVLPNVVFSHYANLGCFFFYIKFPIPEAHTNVQQGTPPSPRTIQVQALE